MTKWFLGSQIRSQVAMTEERHRTCHETRQALRNPLGCIRHDARSRIPLQTVSSMQRRELLRHHCGASAPVTSRSGTLVDIRTPETLRHQLLKTGTEASGTSGWPLKPKSTYFYTWSLISSGKYFTGYIRLLGKHLLFETTSLSVASVVYGTLTCRVKETGGRAIPCHMLTFYMTV